MMLVWIVIFLIFFGVVGMQESFAETQYENSENLRETLYRSGFDTYQLKYNDRDYQLKYKFGSENTLDKIHFDVDANSMVFSITAQAKDELLIEIPFEILLVVISNCNFDDWFVLVDGEQKLPMKYETSSTRILSIPITENDKEIEIIATFVGLAFSYIGDCLEQHHFDSLKTQLSFGANNEDIQCPNNLSLVFKSTNNFPACVKPETKTKLIERGWAKLIPLVGKNSQAETPIEEKMAPLQECSREHNQQEACPEGYVCYEHLSGGLGPFGALPIEPFGGDKLCHKECFTDNDCPLNAPMCLLTKRTTEDTIEAFFLCFSEEKGKKVRNEKFQSCMESKEKSFQDALEKDEKIFDIRNPPKPHKANFNGVMIQFLPYIVNNLNLDVEEVLKNELQLEIIRMGGLDWIAIVSLPEENVVETLCTFELDNRIMSTSFNIDWERVE